MRSYRFGFRFLKLVSGGQPAQTKQRAAMDAYERALREEHRKAAVAAKFRRLYVLHHGIRA